MTRILVIGCGNPLRGDDGLGPYAAQRLADTPGGDGVQVIACHQLTPELAEPVSQADRVILVDAACEGEPGVISCRPVEAGQTLDFTHHLDAAGLLHMAAVLYGRRPAALLLTVSAQSFGYEERFSPPVSAALPEVLEWLYRLTADSTEIEA